MIGGMAEPPRPRRSGGRLGSAEALAKEWLLELIGSRPLGEAVRVSTDRMAADGPALVAAVVAALVSDRELERLGADGEKGCARGRWPGAIAGAGGPAEVVAALERLRSVGLGRHRGARRRDRRRRASRGASRTCARPWPRRRWPRATAGGAHRVGPGRRRTGAIRDSPRGRRTAVDRGVSSASLADGGRSGHRFALLLVDLDTADRLRLAAAEEAA